MASTFGIGGIERFADFSIDVFDELKTFKDENIFKKLSTAVRVYQEEQKVQGEIQEDLNEAYDLDSVEGQQLMDYIFSKLPLAQRTAARAKIIFDYALFTLTSYKAWIAVQ